jgi:hypothetical protein
VFHPTVHKDMVYPYALLSAIIHDYANYSNYSDYSNILASEPWRLGEATFGRLAPRRAGPPLAAKTGRSKIQKWCVTETANFKNDQTDEELVDHDLRQSQLEKDCLVANAAPNANKMQSRPFSLIWSLLSQTIDWSIDRSIV